MRVIQLARKPLQGTLVSNLTKYHTGALCIHGTRIGSEIRINQPAGNKGGQSSYNMGVYGMPQDASSSTARGRWPANIIFQHKNCHVTHDAMIPGKRDMSSPGGKSLHLSSNARSSDVRPIAWVGHADVWDCESSCCCKDQDISLARFFKQVKA